MSLMFYKFGGLTSLHAIGDVLLRLAQDGLDVVEAIKMNSCNSF